MKDKLATASMVLLAVITVVFTFIMFKTLQDSKKEENSSRNLSERVVPTKVISGTKMELTPESVTVKQGETITVSAVLSEIKAEVRSADIIIKYDPTVLEFITVINTDPSYMNLRKMTDNNRLILSFAKNPNKEVTFSDRLRLSDVQFRAIKKSKTELSILFENDDKTSMVYQKNIDDNSLVGAKSAVVVIE